MTVGLIVTFERISSGTCQSSMSLRKTNRLRPSRRSGCKTKSLEPQSSEIFPSDFGNPHDGSHDRRYRPFKAVEEKLAQKAQAAARNSDHHPVNALPGSRWGRRRGRETCQWSFRPPRQETNDFELLGESGSGRGCPGIAGQATGRRRGQGIEPISAFVLFDRL